jgi:uncharacterized protein involved in exopolysaccharide biosynthesis
MKIEPTTRGWITAFFRQLKKCTFVFCMFLLGGLVYIAATKPQYEAAGSLLVKFGRGATPEITRSENSGPEIITQSDRRETIQSDIEILQSHALLYEIVHAFGAENLYPNITKKVAGKDDPEEAAIRELWKSDLVIKSNQKSNLIDVRMVNRNPKIAAQFVHELFQRFIARQSEVFNKPQTNFLENEVKQAAEKLKASQQALENFKEDKEISSMDDEMAELLRQKSDAGTLALDANDDAWARLSEMQEKEAQMRATYLPDSAQVIRQHELVVLAQRQLQQRQADQSTRIGSATAKIKKRIAELEAQRTQYRDLARQVDIDEQNYKNYQLRGENARINDLLNRNSITPIVVVDEPVVPMKPIRPRKKLILAMCLLAGLVFGTGTALIFETLDPRFTSPEQISDILGVPVMANFS